MKTIEKEELREKLKNDEIILIEVLDEEQYNREHIKGAINIPLKKIATEANQKFEKDDAIAVYCSDYECTSSPTAAKKLDDMGFENVYDFEGGKKAWKEAGYPMEKN